MDALVLLEQQHADVGALIDCIAAESSPGRRTALVVRLSRMIDAHLHIEEMYLYPMCAERMRGDRGPLHEAREKHTLARFVADNLLRTRVTDVRFGVRLRLVRDLFDRHASEEEDWMFQKAKRELTDEELDVLGSDLERAYERLLVLSRARPHRIGSVRGPGAPYARSRERGRARGLAGHVRGAAPDAAGTRT